MSSFLIESTLEQMKSSSTWHHAFHEAEFGEYGEHSKILDSVVEVIASAYGENDEEDWIALVRLGDGRFCKMSAGCDYTGWDCQASGVIEFYNTRDELLSMNTLTEQEAARLNIPWK